MTVIGRIPQRTIRNKGNRRKTLTAIEGNVLRGKLQSTVSDALDKLTIVYSNNKILIRLKK
jgi:hypothetical protein